MPGSICLGMCDQGVTGLLPKSMWSDDRSNMHEQNVKALLMYKSNIDLTYTEFYENIKSNVVLLKKVLGTDKYH